MVIVPGLIRHEERVLSDDARVEAWAGDGDNFRQPGLPCCDQSTQRQAFQVPGHASSQAAGASVILVRACARTESSASRGGRSSPTG